MSTDLEEAEVETEMIVLAKDKGADNDALITKLATEWLSLRCSGPEDRATFDLIDSGRKKLVKCRTGLAKQVKDLVAPLKSEIDRIKGSAEKYQAKLTVIEEHLKSEVESVKAEIARREQEAADELYDLRKRRWLEATGNPPDFDGSFPEAFLRALSESEFESEIQRLSEKTRKEREETIKRIEADTLAAKERADEAARIAEENRKLQADREAFELERRKLKAEQDLIAQQQREAQEKIDAETRRLASERGAREEADKPVAGVVPPSLGSASDAPAAVPSLVNDAMNAELDDSSITASTDFHLGFDDQGYGILKFRLMEFSIARSEGDSISRLDEGEIDLWLEIVETLNRHFPRE